MASYMFVPAGDRVYKIRVNESIELEWESDPINPSTTAVVAGVKEGVYVGSKDAALYQLDFTSGKTIKEWSTGFGGPLWGLAHANGVIYFTANSVLYGLAPAAQTFWSRSGMGAEGGPGAGSGVVCTGSGDGTLYGFSANGQAQLWAFAPTGDQTFYSNAEYVFLGNVVFVHSLNVVYKLNAKDGTVLAQTDWSDTGGITGIGFGEGGVYVVDHYFDLNTNSDKASLMKFDMNTLSKVWDHEVPGSLALTDPTHDAGAVLVSSVGLSGNHFVHAFNATNGVKLWDSSVPVSKDDEFVSQVSVDCGWGTVMFVVSEGGTLYAFGRSDGNLAWSIPISMSPGAFVMPPTAWCSRPEKKSFEGAHQAAIDPLWLLLPHEVYVKLHKPYPLPLLERQIDQLAKTMTAAQREATLARARLLGAYVAAVEKAIS